MTAADVTNEALETISKRDPYDWELRCPKCGHTYATVDKKTTGGGVALQCPGDYGFYCGWKDRSSRIASRFDTCDK